MPAPRDRERFRASRPTDSQPRDTTMTELASEPVVPVRVYSLTGSGYNDDRFGVSFVAQPWADVAPDLAQRMVEFRPEVVTKNEDGVDVVTTATEPLYALEAPQQAEPTPAPDNPNP